MARKKWSRLDNAALIFPAIMRHNWNNGFRIAITLNEDVDREILKMALKDLRKRFPSFYVSLHSGFFWYYLEEMDGNIPVEDDYAYPLTPMSRSWLRKSCVRVLVYRKRFAVEFFHSVTDGTGGLIFAKNLCARYLEIKHGIEIPHKEDILDIEEEQKAEELEDAFQRVGARIAYNEKEKDAYHVSGTPEPDNFRHLITGILDTRTLLDKAHEYNCSLTVFTAAVMVECVRVLQAREKALRDHRPDTVQIAVNLRKCFPTKTLRNFALAVNIGIDPRLGEYSFAELCTELSHQLSLKTSRQRLSGMVSANVQPARNLAVRMLPLFLKNTVMRMVYLMRGETKGSLNISNIGVVKLPEEMEAYVSRVEFIIGVQYTYPNNASVTSYNGKTYINMIRSIKESELERLFFSRLVEMGVPVSIESN